MRRIINSYKYISFIARSPENENGTSVERENAISESDKNSVFDLSNKKRKEIRDTGEPIRNAQRGGYNIEIDEVGRFFGYNREKAKSDLKTLEEETKDKSPEEKNDAVLKFIREKGEFLKQEINDEKQEYLKENESELPMFGGAGEANPQDEQSLGETEAILARIRQVNRQAKLDH